MPRKTVNVKELLDYANVQLLRNDEDATKEFKEGICGMVEKILHSSGNYNGFMFIRNEDSEVNTMGYVTRKYF